MTDAILPCHMPARASNQYPLSGRSQESILLVLPVPFRRVADKLLFERQACNGLNRWADNFEKVVVAAPVMPESLARKETAITWEDSARVLDAEKIECVELPWSYAIKDFAHDYSTTRRLLASQIRQCNYLQFAIGGLVGDWAAVAALEAHSQGRPFTIHTDRVEHQLLLELVRGQRNLRALKVQILAPVMERYHRYIIERCCAGLWHGRDCYSYYSAWSKSNYLIHDVHTQPADAISQAALDDKITSVLSLPEIRIGYAGRMSSMKAPVDWLKAIAHARSLGARISATWYGDGELRGQMEAGIKALNLSGIVNLPGFVSSRETMLARLRDSHLLVFTHITPESPRCLLESLICGTPLAGYDSDFARDLTDERGGGSYVPRHDWRALGELIASLASNRKVLAKMIGQAARNGSRFNDRDVFRERSEIIKSATRQQNQKQNPCSEERALS
jgi:glycosyltransferase involved in cell wall biosynthesis